LNNTPFPSIQALAEYLKIARRTIHKFLDSDQILKSKNIKVYLYSKEINLEKTEELKSNFKVANLKVKPEV
jgi:hypothetical protein